MPRTGCVGTATCHVVEDQHSGRLSYHTTTEQHLGVLNANKRVRNAEAVPLTTMDEVLKDHTVAVIDVEGGELDLLDGLDLAKHRPRVMLIENAMLRHPYTQVGWIQTSRVYVHNDEKEVLARAENRR